MSHQGTEIRVRTYSNSASFPDAAEEDPCSRRRARGPNGTPCTNPVSSSPLGASDRRKSDGHRMIKRTENVFTLLSKTFSPAAPSSAAKTYGPQSNPPLERPGSLEEPYTTGDARPPPAENCFHGVRSDGPGSVSRGRNASEESETVSPSRTTIFIDLTGSPDVRPLPRTALDSAALATSMVGSHVDVGGQQTAASPDPTASATHSPLRGPPSPVVREGNFSSKGLSPHGTSRTDTRQAYGPAEVASAKKPIAVDSIGRKVGLPLQNGEAELLPNTLFPTTHKSNALTTDKVAQVSPLAARTPRTPPSSSPDKDQGGTRQNSPAPYHLQREAQQTRTVGWGRMLLISLQDLGRDAATGTFDSAAFDSQIYAQEGAPAPPPGVTVSAVHAQGFQPSGRGRVFTYADPAIQMVHSRTEEWHRWKSAEIQRRPSRKKWFGKVVQRQRWLRALDREAHERRETARSRGLFPIRLDPVPRSVGSTLESHHFGHVPEDLLPSDVRENAAWAKACARFRSDWASRQRERRLKSEARKRMTKSRATITTTKTITNGISKRVRSQQRPNYRDIIFKESDSEARKRLKELALEVAEQQAERLLAEMRQQGLQGSKDNPPKK